jgi:stage II sporulation protein AA (anti-sigma F factor antagonist)
MERRIMSNNPLVRNRINDDTCVIVAASALDNNNAHEMHEAIGELLGKGFKHIIIDMRQLEFLASAGVGSIIGNVETAREAGGDIVLCNLSATIRHVLDVLDLGDYLTLMENVDEATAQLGVSTRPGQVE